MKIYVASSWRNEQQPAVVQELRAAGHEVYDFRNPAPGDTGFAWSDIDPDWQSWSPELFRKSLSHPIAKHVFRSDMDALRNAEATVLVMPCGRSAHLELGYAVGTAEQHTAILLCDGEPELMYNMVDLLTVNIGEVIAWLAGIERRRQQRD